MKKAVFYGRYSSANQTEQSIEGQLHVCEKYAADNDIFIVGQYIDRAMTATNDKRPQFRQMIADSSKGGFDTVLVYKLDRFARNRYDSAIHKKKLRDNGVRVVSATEPLSDSPEGIILEGLLEGIDEYFSAELSRKCKRGLKESCDKGYFICNTVPPGYKKVDRKLEIDPETGPLIRRIFSEYADGKSPERIAKELNEQGLTVDGRAFHKKTIRDWMKNEVFIGRYHCGDNIVEVPAVIDQELWERVQKIRENRSHLYRDNRGKYRYYLTGRLFCGICGSRVCGRSTNGFNYYYCENCNKHITQAEPLHEKVKIAIYEYLTPKKIHDIAKAAYREYMNAEVEDPTIPLRKELKQVKKLIDNIVNAIMQGIYAPTMNEKLNELENRKSILENQIASSENHSPQLTLEHFEYFLSQVLEYPDEKFEQLLGILVDRVVVSKEHIIICINLTNTDNEPPLEQIRIEEPSLSARSPYAYITADWLLLVA